MKTILSKAKGIGVCFLLLVMSQFGGTLILFQSESGTGFTIMETLLITSLMLGLCWSAIAYAYLKGWLSLSMNWLTSNHLRLLALSYPAIWGISLLGSVIMESQGATEMANQETLENLFTTIPVFLAMIMVVVSAPIFEEILCRAAVPNLLFPKFPRIGLLVGTIFFAWLHGPSHIGAWVIYFGMGAVFAFLRYKTGRLELAIAAHMLWNAVALAMSYLV
ncbi:CPBP family intramembrane glutamic endopeptidase [Streptococcus merionis]|uniref:CPBP family intramembrane glutamic endopeptidase n=1 Tax=Streptococcus merionis TaxID=400065 RepID=UPI00351823D5